MTIKKEFLVERQGKQFVLYAGLLAMAHDAGLTSVQTTLVQVPSEGNNRTAICKAVVTLEKDGKMLMFEGIGDAAPNNVAPAMQTCLIRMAETRSKSRAFRDAVNVGVAALEELGNEEQEDAPYQNVRRNPSRVRSMGSRRQEGQVYAPAQQAAPASKAASAYREQAQNYTPAPPAISADEQRAINKANLAFWKQAQTLGYDPDTMADADVDAWFAELLGHAAPATITVELWDKMRNALPAPAAAAPALTITDDEEQSELDAEAKLADTKRTVQAMIQ